MEHWKVIPSYPLYEASNEGNIRNTKTKYVLKPYHVPNGYSQVRLSLGRTADFVVRRIHRLVAEAWIPNPGNKPTVNHKNRDHHDNRVENLEWMSHAEQSDHLHSTTDKKQVVRRTQKAIIPNEEWKTVEGFTTYLVSNYGRVKRVDQANILQGHTKSVYDQVKIWNDELKKYQTKYIHKLVAYAFLQNYDEKLIVNHKDGNKKNNHVDNLEYISQSENIVHAYESGKISRRVPICQYTMDDAFVAEFKSFAEAEKRTGVRAGGIKWAILNKNGKRAGYIWKLQKPCE